MPGAFRTFQDTGRLASVHWARDRHGVRRKTNWTFKKLHGFFFPTFLFKDKPPPPFCCLRYGIVTPFSPPQSKITIITKMPHVILVGNRVICYYWFALSRRSHLTHLTHLTHAVYHPRINHIRINHILERSFCKWQSLLSSHFPIIFIPPFLLSLSHYPDFLRSIYEFSSLRMRRPSRIVKPSRKDGLFTTRN